MCTVPWSYGVIFLFKKKLLKYKKKFLSIYPYIKLLFFFFLFIALNFIYFIYLPSYISIFSFQFFLIYLFFYWLTTRLLKWLANPLTFFILFRCAYSVERVIKNIIECIKIFFRISIFISLLILGFIFIPPLTISRGQSVIYFLINYIVSLIQIFGIVILIQKLLQKLLKSRLPLLSISFFFLITNQWFFKLYFFFFLILSLLFFFLYRYYLWASNRLLNIRYINRGRYEIYTDRNGQYVDKKARIPGLFGSPASDPRNAYFCREWNGFFTYITLLILVFRRVRVVFSLDPIEIMYSWDSTLIFIFFLLIVHAHILKLTLRRTPRTWGDLINKKNIYVLWDNTEPLPDLYDILYMYTLLIVIYTVFVR